MDAQSMNIGLHHVAERLEYHTVALDSADAGKGVRKDSYLEMPSAIPGTRVARVQVTLILDQDFDRRKRPLENLLYALSSVDRHGNTSLNGFTITCR